MKSNLTKSHFRY